MSYYITIKLFTVVIYNLQRYPYIYINISQKLFAFIQTTKIDMIVLIKIIINHRLNQLLPQLIQEKKLRININIINILFVIKKITID